MRVLVGRLPAGARAPVPRGVRRRLAAYRWVVDHAAELGADPARLAVGGDSAGRHAAGVGRDRRRAEGLPLAFQLLVYPGTDMRGGTQSRDAVRRGPRARAGLHGPRPGRLPAATRRTLVDPRASPMLAELPPGLCPAYVATAGFDPLRDEGEAYARRLADAGVEVELRRFSDQLHGFVQMVGVGRTARAAAEVAAAWPRRCGQPCTERVSQAPPGDSRTSVTGPSPTLADAACRRRTRPARPGSRRAPAPRRPRRTPAR